MVGRMLVQNTFARGASNPAQLIRGQSEGIDHITGLRGNQNFSSRLKELLQPFPMIADYRRLTSGGLEQPSRWAYPISAIADLVTLRVNLDKQ